MEVFVNLYVFPLPVELVLTLILVVRAAVSAFAGTEDDLAVVKRLADRLLTLAGVILLAYVVIRLVAGWEGFVSAQGWERFALPVWLTVGTMPFVVLLGWWSNYDTAFSMIPWASDDRHRRMRARLALVTGLHVRARDVGEFNGQWAKRLAAASSLADARAAVRRFRERDPAAV